MNITRELQIELYAYTAGVLNARREYDAHPNAACLAHDCFDLAPDDDVVCPEHRRLRDDAARRMKKNRNRP